MSRGHTPYGYRIENGTAIICEIEAEKIRKMYKGYLGGLSMVGAALEAGLEWKHSSVKRLMQNRHLLGDDFYPAIIDRETFDAFEMERKHREKVMGRDHKEKKEIKDRPAPISFRMGTIETISSDPFRQAEYIYDSIESEV